MKKFIICFLILILSINSVNAIEYTEYSEFSDWSLNSVEPNDLTNVETENRYRWYKNNEIFGGYYKEGENSTEYNLIDYYDYIYSEYSEWTDIYNDSHDIVEEKEVYTYSEVLPVRYIVLDEFYGGENGRTIFSEINILRNNQTIYYDTYCEKCSSGLTSVLNNFNTYDKTEYVNSDGKIVIDLQNYYDIKDLTIHVFWYDNIWSTKSYRMIIKRDLIGEEYFTYTESDYFNTSTLTEPRYNSHKVTDSWVKLSPRYGEIQYSDVPVQTNILNKFLDSIIFYRYQDKLYKNYMLEREYYDNEYYINIDGYIKDEEDYMIYYRYQTRNIIENLKFTNEKLINNNIINTNINDTNSVDLEEQFEFKYDDNYIEEIREVINNEKPNTNGDYLFGSMFILVILLSLFGLYTYFKERKFKNKLSN